MRLKIMISGFFVLVAIAALVSFFVLKKTDQGQALSSAHSQLALIASPSQDSHRPNEAFVASASGPDYLPLRNFNIPEPEIHARAAVLFDTRSGKFLYQQNGFKQLPIASLTKLMTAVVVVENLNLDDVITIPVEDLNVDGLGADLAKDERIVARDLLKVMLIKSSNDAASAFDTYASKQNIDLVGLMNAKAQELGMNATRFTNPAGLDDNAFSTAADLIKLVQYVGKHPIIWQILRMPAADVSSVDGMTQHHLINTDQLLSQISGIIGGKTGFTDRAMGTMILVVDVRSGFSNLIGIVLGSNDRFSDVKSLIEWGRAAHRWQ